MLHVHDLYLFITNCFILYQIREWMYTVVHRISLFSNFFRSIFTLTIITVPNKNFQIIQLPCFMHTSSIYTDRELLTQSVHGSQINVQA